MSVAKDPTLRGLNDRGCCEGMERSVPLEVYNRPGLDAVAYRIGTHARFKETLLARLSDKRFPALNQLRTRDGYDFTIAFLDAFSVMADVLTFYQERIANESYLRTATETASLHHLAGLIGYRPRPGVAAAAWLAFTMEAAEGAPDRTRIEKGTRVQSIPGPGEKPQVFETVAAITARPAWNALLPRLTFPQELRPDMTFAVLAGVATGLKAGDRVLVAVGENPAAFRVQAVRKAAPDPERGTTRVDFASGAPQPRYPLLEARAATFFTEPRKLTGSLVQDRIFQHAWPTGQLLALARVQQWPVRALAQNLVFRAREREITPHEGLFALRQKAAVFGHNAPGYQSLEARAQGTGGSWEGRTLADESRGNRIVYLDRVYEGILPGAWVVLACPAGEEVFQVERVADMSRSDFTLSAKVTRLTLDREPDDRRFTLRNTTVLLAGSNPLALADLPISEDIPADDHPDRLELDTPDLELAAGRKVILTGERTDLEGVNGHELLTVKEATVVAGRTRLSFTQAIQHRYRRDSVRLNANVALATHGEQVEEVLGSGDAREAFQHFELRQPPLTYTAAANPRGAVSTLEVRVDGIRWREVDTLFGQGPEDQVYLLETDWEGRSFVRFGDGQTGARLPTGTENVRAVYRKGMGEGGLVDRDQLRLLLTRPMGVREVTNPIAVAGAEDRESRERIRQNAPLPIMTLDRVVSLKDYEDFARAFGGIAKALATWTWDGARRGVFLTVAGPGGAAVESGGATHANLLAALQEAGDPLIPVRVATFRPAFFRVEALLKVHPDHEAAAVQAAAETDLRRCYAFAVREFGRDVTRAEVIAALQGTRGVVAVDLNLCYRTDAPGPSLETRLPADLPRAGARRPLAAELLMLDPRPVPLGIMS